MSRSIIKAAEWTLGQETGEGVPTAIFQVRCITCGAESAPTDNTRLPVEVWALQHTGRNTTHRQFQAVCETFWRVEPAPNNPLHQAGTISRG